MHPAPFLSWPIPSKTGDEWPESMLHAIQRYPVSSRSCAYLPVEGVA